HDVLRGMPLPTTHVFHHPFQPHPRGHRTLKQGGLIHREHPTRSYGEIAEQIGAPGAARAVGFANGSNPIAIIVPCHRVIGAGGGLTGYGGGLDRKKALLELEKRRTATSPTLFD
ncbi:methylated-DNA--[protein]-cysteine S-methyltransferase, partial [Mycobacterium heckeshornense]|uniref:methylated-DNA--[protein]-cysteine S-methyltransferase n=1 Tax=Mycobacterium heckeshornense TaxID=110505 RepID=UPI0021F31A5C